MIPMVSSYGCVQDWDALYQFCHGPIADNLDRTTGYFDQTGNPAKFAFYPSMSRMFRQAMLSPAAEQLSKSIESGTWRQAPYVSQLWNTDSQSVTDTLTHRIGVIVNDDHASGAMAVKPKKSSGEIQLMTKSQGAVWTANSPSAWVCTGFIGGQLLETGSVKLQSGELPDQFGSVTLVTLDDQPITHSKRMLVTAAGVVKTWVWAGIKIVPVLAASGAKDQCR